jgi:hypothetical protein
MNSEETPQRIKDKPCTLKLDPSKICLFPSARGAFQPHKGIFQIEAVDIKILQGLFRKTLLLEYFFILNLVDQPVHRITERIHYYLIQPPDPIDTAIALCPGKKLRFVIRLPHKPIRLLKLL